MNRSLQSLRAYLHKGGEVPQWSPEPGVVVVGSGKGGAGTSSVSALLALAGARENRRVLLVDGDESLGSLGLYLGYSDPGPGLGDLRGGEVEPRDLLHQVFGSLWLLPGGGGGSEATLATSLGERRTLFHRVTELFEAFDLIILDGGSHLASVMAACSTRPERLLAVTTPDRVAMAATHALLKVARNRYPELPSELLINFADTAVADETFQMMAQAGEKFLDIRPSFAGSVPDDPELRDHMAVGAPLTRMDPQSPALAAVWNLHGRLAAEQESLQAGFGKVLPFPA
jgi:MinD-like ATPase involved in chromosome partitioning or flagellar assembly